MRDRYLKEGTAEYAKRLSRFCELELVEVEDERAPEALSDRQAGQVKKREAERILARIREGSYVIALDVGGVKLSSEELASKLEELMLAGFSSITFIIGGSIGMDASVLEKAGLRLSFSDMTFPHQLMRLILAEQIYRAFKIIRGETYHK